MRDPQIRSYADSPPLYPDPRGTHQYGWPDVSESDVDLVRSFMQEGGRGMFVLRAPTRGTAGQEWKALVEAYYGDEIRPGFFERDLVDPQRQDSRDGKLVVVSELKRYFGHLTSADLMEFKRNNRSSRRDLRRHASAASRERELRQLIEEEAEAEYREAADEAADALVDIATWAQTPSSTSPSKRT
jgi:hypothetical protein